MKCPYCNISIAFQPVESSGFHPLDESEPKVLAQLQLGRCPDCKKLIAVLLKGTGQQIGNKAFAGAGFGGGGFGGGGFFAGPGPTNSPIDLSEEIILPRLAVPRIIEAEVPERFAQDYREAALTLQISSKASAALSRRVLQDILREHRHVKAGRLVQEIEDFIHQPGVPSEIANAVDAVRNVGNFAAHPSKDTNTGEIVDVDPGEAEWLLEVLDAMFDFVFVQPKRLEIRRADLNEKLEKLGRPPMKESRADEGGEHSRASSNKTT